MEQGVPELGACGLCLWRELSDYSGEVREDRVTPKGHRKTVHERGRERGGVEWEQDEVTGHGLRFGHSTAELGSQMEVLLAQPECSYTWAVGMSK